MGDCSTATSLNDNLLNVCRVGTFMLGLEHVGFYCMEAEFWRTVGVKSFRVKKHEINPTSPLAANQGVYNLLVGIACVFSSIPWIELFPNTSSGQFAGQVYESYAAGGRWLFTALIYAVGVYGWQSLGSAMIMKVQGTPGLIMMVLNILFAHGIGTGAVDDDLFSALHGAGAVMVAVWTLVGALCGVRAAQWKGKNDTAAKLLEMELAAKEDKK